ncbi:hypothetical protein CRUP_008025 [Coryphaenoides rupestris]|nr:hypothetical protein CRUP_008025 [Coryphaenoides rupestris]
MSIQNEESAVAESNRERDYSSSSDDDDEDDEGDIQCAILERQRDGAQQKLSELEHVSSQLLQEIDALETQFQVERCCRENAQALAVKVTKENRALKRKSQMMMPLILELPDDATFEPQAEAGEVWTRRAAAKLQATVDTLLAEKMALEQRLSGLKAEISQLKEQLALELQEKEAILKNMNKQTKTMNKMKRVSQLVTEEFSEMSQQLELEQGLRQHAEVLAHQSQRVMKENMVFTELQTLRVEKEMRAQERRSLEVQLSAARDSVKQLQREVNQLKQALKGGQGNDRPAGENSLSPPPPLACPPPPPPPPLPPPPSAPAINPLDALRDRKKKGRSKEDTQEKAAPAGDQKGRMMDQMMDRIRTGIALRPITRPPPIPQTDNSSWEDSMRLKDLRRAASTRKRINQNTGEAELERVLNRRRRAIGDDSLASCPVNPAASDPSWGEEASGVPVLRRLRQNREKRDSRIRASTAVVSKEFKVAPEGATLKQEDGN